MLSRSCPARLAAALAVAACLSALGCAFGDEPGGCRGDAECPARFRCRAGACFRITPDPIANGGGGAGGAPDAARDGSAGD